MALSTSSRILDTIVAPITGQGSAPVAIVRVSGSEAWRIAAGVFPSWPADVAHAQAYYGQFAHGDDGYAIRFEDGRSYTYEDTVEFFIHGSTASVSMLIEACISLGARMAEPGEFTLRAFQNGRIDLTEAEAVRDTIEAQTERQLRLANDLRLGALNQEIAAIQEAVVSVLVAVEASVDFSEEIGELNVDMASSTIESQLKQIDRLLATANAGRILREGFRVAILGPPNAGKSSLLNAILGTERAIVTPNPGTTRDLIEEAVELDGLKVILIDTAGLRETDDLAESLGVERSLSAVEGADKVWFVFDSETGITDEDQRKIGMLQEMRRGHHPADAPLVVANKSDLAMPSVEAQERAALAIVSAKTREGLEGLLKRTVMEALAAPPNAPFIQRRHKLPLQQAKEALQHCLATLTNDRPHDLLSVDLQSAIASLGEITGESASVDMIDRIFHDFCIGK